MRDYYNNSLESLRAELSALEQLKKVIDNAEEDNKNERSEMPPSQFDFPIEPISTPTKKVEIEVGDDDNACFFDSSEDLPLPTPAFRQYIRNSKQ